MPDGAESREPTRVLSYNVLYHLNRPDQYAWEERRDAIADTIADQNPDVVCLQEVWRNQLKDLQERLPDYEWVAPPDDNEHTVIAYLPDRYTVLEEGSRWLSEPGADPGTPGWDGPYQKRFTHTTFRDEHTGVEFVVFSVVPEGSVVPLNLLGGKCRTIAGILNRLKISRIICLIAFEFDDYQLPFRIECENI